MSEKKQRKQFRKKLRRALRKRDIDKRHGISGNKNCGADWSGIFSSVL